MKVTDLIELLSTFPGDFEVKVIDALYEEEHEFDKSVIEMNEEDKKIKLHFY